MLPLPGEVTRLSGLRLKELTLRQSSPLAQVGVEPTNLPKTARASLKPESMIAGIEPAALTVHNDLLSLSVLEACPSNV